MRGYYKELVTKSHLIAKIPTFLLYLQFSHDFLFVDILAKYVIDYRVRHSLITPFYDAK